MFNTDEDPPPRNKAGTHAWRETLKQMLSWGIYVFPIKAGGNTPLLKDWENTASNDPVQIAKWEKQFPGCNWAAAPGRSGHSVLDPDVKKGKRGPQELRELEVELGNLPPTLTVGTPSGGFHHWFNGTTRSSTGDLAPGVDVKSRGGYVLIPPSKTKVGTYRVLSDVDALPDLPGAWAARIGKPRNKKKRTETPACELDTEDNIRAATEYAKVAEASISGQGGDLNAFRVCCRVRDFGVEQETCFSLLLEHWNPRCVPEWSIEELTTKVRNAYLYAQKPAGTESPEKVKETFESVGEKGGKKTPGGKSPPPGGINAADLLDLELPDMEWVVEKLLPPGLVVLAGKPKLGKSWMVLQLALEVGRGGEFLGHKCSQGDTLFLALEDGNRRLKKRLLRMKAGKDAARRITFHTDWKKTDHGGLEDLDNTLSGSPGIRLVIIDVWQKLRPSVKAKNATSYEIDYNEVALIKRIADKHGVVILLVTHLRKNGKVVDVFEEINGSNGIFGSADVSLILARFRNVADAELHITGRDIEEHTLALIKDQETFEWRSAGNKEDVQSTPERQKIIDAFSALGPSKPSAVAEWTGFDVQYIRNVLPKIIETGLIERVKYGCYRLKPSSNFEPV